MCGRYYRRSDKQRIAEAFHLGQLPDGFVLPPDYNIAPSTFQPIIRNSRDTGERELVLMRWGMVPHFAKSLADFKGLSTINAKAETLQSSATWRVPFQRRRCLVPADGFYEWKKIVLQPGMDGYTNRIPLNFSRSKAQLLRLANTVKQPYAFMMKDERPFAFAGLWDAWKDPTNGSWLQGYSIVTTDPNELTARVHNRMPVILEAKDYDRWLSRDEGKRPPVDLLRPIPAEEIKAHEVSKDVGNVKNNGPELISPGVPRCG